MSGSTVEEVEQAVTLDYYDLENVADRGSTIVAMQGILERSAKVGETRLCSVSSLLTSACNCL